MWDWLIDIWHWLFGKPDKMRLKDNICMPLFYSGSSGNVLNTWTYLNMSHSGQEQCRRMIKAAARSWETPAITFLLSPSNEAGGIFDEPFPTINESDLEWACEAIEELVEDGIAVFPTLYTDDKLPWWYDARDHMAGWKRVHEVIGKHVNGYMLSIESEEQAASIGELQDRIQVMREVMPGVDYYGTHMHWKGKSKRSSYRWLGGSTTPENANLILAENSWHPNQGDRMGVEKLKIEAQAIIANNSGIKLVMQEYNMNPAGSIAQAQREALRELKPFGVG